MDDKQLYSQLLCLGKEWRVQRVELNIEKEEVRVYVENTAVVGAAEFGLRCPECDQVCPQHDTREERSWRHLDSCSFSTYLVARVPRIDCAKHGVKTVAVPWAGPHARFTLAFECFAIRVLECTQVQSKAATLLRLTPTQVHHLMARAVDRGLKRRQEVESGAAVRQLSLDEKSFRKGHRYITVLGDTAQCRVLEVAEGRTRRAACALLRKALTKKQRARVESVSMDMWAAYIKAQQKMLPQADIVHDRFHVAKYLNEAVDQTRRMEQRRFAQANHPDSPLRKTKYLWLIRPERLSPSQRELLETIRQRDLETAKVWSHKESFRSFFSATGVTEAHAFFVNWRESATDLGNKFLTRVAYMLENHLRGLLNYQLHHTSNATAEGLNGQIQRIKANARGFRRFSNFRIAILFFLGKLDLYPQTSS